MRLLYLLFDITLIVLFALVAWWASQHAIRPLPPVTHYPPVLPLPPIGSGTDSSPELPPLRINPSPPPKLRPAPPAHVAKLVNSVYEQSKVTRSYNPAYVQLPYPGGDVDQTTGVCTDVVIRAFRAQAVDLQEAVHKDMRRHFGEYPKKWGLRSPDTNIDHRRVPNLMTFFERQGKSLPVSDEADHYQPGDVVVWELDSGQHHIGVVVTERSDDELRPLMGHNINEGTKVEDVLFAWKVIGHYRFFEPLLAENSRKPKPHAQD